MALQHMQNEDHEWLKEQSRLRNGFPMSKILHELVINARKDRFGTQVFKQLPISNGNTFARSIYKLSILLEEPRISNDTYDTFLRETAQHIEKWREIYDGNPVPIEGE